VPPRPQHPPTRRTAQQPADQLSLHQHQLGAYDQHRGATSGIQESPPDATTKLAGGLSRVHERPKPANPATTITGTITPAGDQTQRRSTPLDLGESAQGHRRIIPQTGGTFRGPEIAGKLLPGASADWQIVLPDGTALADIRYTVQTDDGALLYVQSRGVRHGSPEVLDRLARGEDVNAGEYTFRTTTQIETAAPDLDWLNKGVFISVGGRQAAGVVYETYLVG
jgi:hypothetical protein